MEEISDDANTAGNAYRFIKARTLSSRSILQEPVSILSV